MSELCLPPGIPWTVNVIHTDQVRPYVGPADLLTTMFEQQRMHIPEMSNKYRANGVSRPDPDIFGSLDNRLVQDAIRSSINYTVEELYEALGHLKAKPWKESYRPVSRSAFEEEVADAFHFFLEALIFAGISPETLFMAYFDKTQIVKARRENGY